MHVARSIEGPLARTWFPQVPNQLRLFLYLRRLGLDKQLCARELPFLLQLLLVQTQFLLVFGQSCLVRAFQVGIQSFLFSRKSPVSLQ